MWKKLTMLLLGKICSEYKLVLFYLLILSRLKQSRQKSDLLGINVCLILTSKSLDTKNLL